MNKFKLIDEDGSHIDPIWYPWFDIGGEGG